MGKCSRCGKEIISSGIGTGYGVNDKGEKHCYDCCAEIDKQYMRENGRITLYYNSRSNSVTNWPATLNLPISAVAYGRHNFARHRTTVWFTFEGQSWIGVQYGTDSEICHCRRLKRKG